jgi:hypothetical protein
VELLEHEADRGGAQGRQVTVAQPRDVVAQDAHDAGGRPVERAGEMQQRGLAGAGRPDDRGELAGADGEVRPAQRGDPTG